MSQQDTLFLSAEYFPSIAWYAHRLQADRVGIHTRESFVRSSLHNRCYITGPNGILMLSVPLLGGRSQRQSIQEVKISYAEDWRQHHWKSLQTCYRRTPYFEYYMAAFEAFYRQSYTYLIELNRASIQLLDRCLSMHTSHPIDWSSDDEALQAYGKVSHLRVPRERLPQHHFRYVQAFSDRHGFVNGLSTLDLLFCAGAKALQPSV